MGMQQDCPGNVALVFLAEFLPAPPSNQNGFEEEVDDNVNKGIWAAYDNKKEGR